MSARWLTDHHVDADLRTHNTHYRNPKRAAAKADRAWRAAKRQAHRKTLGYLGPRDLPIAEVR